MHWPMLLEGDDLVGLDVGERTVSAVRLRSQPKGHWMVQNAGVMELAPGATEKDVAHALHALWRQQGISCTKVCSCLRSPSLLVRYFKYPPMTDEEIQSAIRLAAEDALQLPPDQFQMDWQLFARPVQSVPPPRGAPQEGFHVAVARKESQRHLDLLEAAGLHAGILDVGCVAIANLYLTLHDDAQSGGAVCLIHPQDHCVDLALLNGNNFLYPRSIYSPTQAWVQNLDRLVDNVRNELKYFEFKLSQPQVQRVVLMGPAFFDGPQREQLQEALALPVEQWDPRQDPRFHVSRAARAAWTDDTHGPLSVTSLGLAMRTG